ncbi:hypothetical protein HK096_010730, partial [Nowakowskiella sp. JEL0078]
KSQEEFEAKFSSAVARKKTIEQERVVKAKEIVDRAKEIAARTRQETDVEVSIRLEKLKEKLDSAAGKRGATSSLKRQKLEMHSKTVNERKSAISSPVRNVQDLQEKLRDAETRRK